MEDHTDLNTTRATSSHTMALRKRKQSTPKAKPLQEPEAKRTKLSKRTKTKSQNKARPTSRLMFPNLPATVIKKEPEETTTFPDMPVETTEQKLSAAPTELSLSEQRGVQGSKAQYRHMPKKHIAFPNLPVKVRPKEMPARRSPFLGLPAELRNMIYAEMLEDEARVILPRGSTSGHSFVVAATLSRVNRQMRQEFKSLAMASPSVIQTTVRNFNFMHVVAFLNKLSDTDFERMKRVPSGQPAECRLVIQLEFQEMDVSLAGLDLRRWIRGCEPYYNKRTSKVRPTYQMSATMAKEVHELSPPDNAAMSWFILQDILKVRSTWHEGIKRAMDRADRAARSATA